MCHTGSHIRENPKFYKWSNNNIVLITDLAAGNPIDVEENQKKKKLKIFPSKARKNRPRENSISPRKSVKREIIKLLSAFKGDNTNCKYSSVEKNHFEIFLGEETTSAHYREISKNKPIGEKMKYDHKSSRGTI